MPSWHPETLFFCTEKTTLTLNDVRFLRNLPFQNQFDCIDLSDNALVRVESFPKLARLKVLLLCNNRITKIGNGLQGMLSAEMLAVLV